MSLMDHEPRTEGAMGRPCPGPSRDRRYSGRWRERVIARVGKRRYAGNREDDMTRVGYWIGVCSLWLLTLPAAVAAYAQGGNYPARPVTIISDAAPGAAPDVVARFVADGLGKIWGP